MKEPLALDHQQSQALARLSTAVDGLDENLAYVLKTSKAGSGPKAFVHGFLEQVVLLLESWGVTGPLTKSNEMVGSTPSERAADWLRRNRWHLLAYTGLTVTVLVLLWQLNQMNQAIHDNRALFTENLLELHEDNHAVQQQLIQINEKLGE